LRKIAPILLLSIYLASTTEIYQLAKFPLLVEHYISHKHANKDLSLWAFFCMHYNTDKVHDGDDMKLPFKSHHRSLAFSITIAAPYTIEPEPTRPGLHKLKAIPLHNEAFLPGAFPTPVWQPPKVC
jgi:hypothetical protein